MQSYTTLRVRFINASQSKPLAACRRLIFITFFTYYILIFFTFFWNTVEQTVCRLSAIQKGLKCIQKKGKTHSGYGCISIHHHYYSNFLFQWLVLYFFFLPSTMVPVFLLRLWSRMSGIAFLSSIFLHNFLIALTRPDVSLGSVPLRWMVFGSFRFFVFLRSWVWGLWTILLQCECFSAVPLPTSNDAFLPWVLWKSETAGVRLQVTQSLNNRTNIFEHLVDFMP